MSDRATAFMRPLPPPHSMNMTGCDEREAGGRCMEFEHGQGAVYTPSLSPVVIEVRPSI